MRYQTYNSYSAYNVTIKKKVSFNLSRCNCDYIKLKPFVYDNVLGWRVGHFICHYQVGRDSASEKTGGKR